MFVFQVRKAGRFIEDNNGRIFQNCPRNANPLLFSARQLYAVLAQFSFVAIRKAHNKIVDLRSFGRGLFTENFALSSSEQTPENFAFAAMFPERTALLRPDERTRLIYRQKDVKTEYMANSVSKEYLIALSTKNLDDYKRVAFSSYSGTAYTDVCTNAFGLVKVEVNGAPAYVPHQMDVTGGYSGAPLYALNPKKRLQFYWNPLPQAMRDAGYRQKIKYTLNGTDYPVTASSYNNNLLFQIIPVNSYSYQTEVQQLGITVELYKDGEPLRLSGASNMFLMRYRMMSETDVAIPEVTLTVKDGDLIAASAATDSPAMPQAMVR